ncbi:twitching motility protein PilT [Bacteroidia bacterium]|nr:twitching motility protein PilT [Bacteroidia bacterium]
MERYLVDTHIALFWMFEDDELEQDVQEILNDCGALIYISTVSVQEMMHLRKRNKIQFEKNPEELLKKLRLTNMQLLPVKWEHLETYARLSMPDGHNDPSDHLIISQAITEKMRLVSSDHWFRKYTKQKLELLFNNR